MKSHEFCHKTIAVALLGAAALAPLALAEVKKPKYTTKDVMKAIHKGDDNIGKRISKNTASKEDIEKLVEYYASLPLNDPPRGEKASWETKTAALVKASQELKGGKPNALEHFKEAVNCKSCHEAHKPQDKEKK